MKKRTSLRAILVLIFLSAGIYTLQIVLFHDVKDTAFYLLQDFAFLPVQVALVTVIAGQIVSARERETRIEKTRMLMGSFFSDVGAQLLAEMRPEVTGCTVLAPLLQVDDRWEKRDFEKAAGALRALPFSVSCRPETFARLKALLNESRMPLLVISSNPVLLEHEDFTDMLWAIFHLTDEFAARTDFALLPAADAAHLNADAQRVLSTVLVNWLRHMAYLKAEYPYLYLLEAHRNPFLTPAG